MTEILSPLTNTTSPSPRSQTPENTTDSLPQARAQPLERVPSYAQKRMSTYSHTSQSSRPQSAGGAEYPAFTSSLPYALVRDFAYPVFHPLHYGSALEPSGASTPTSTSEWNPARRQSAPDQQWFHNTTPHVGGWSAGPWGGDGVMYGDPEHDDNLAALPSTSFSSTAEQGVAPLEFAEDEVQFKKGRHRKSKSYGSIPDYERGRRRESGRRSRGGVDGGETGIFWFHGQGRESNGGRKDSRNSGQATLSSRSFHHSASTNANAAEIDADSDEPIPLDAEPHSTHSPQRDSMGPEDEELFAGPSLALYSFEPENSNELRLEEGQEIMVSYRHGQGWLVASDPETGEQGLVPEAYVRLIADMPNYDPETGQFVDVEEYEEDTENSQEATDSRQHEGWSGEQEGTNGAVQGDVAAAKKMAASKIADDDEDVESPGRRGALSSTLFPV